MKSTVFLVCTLFFTPWARAASRFSVGTPSSLLARLSEENTAVTRNYTLPTSSAGYLQVEVEDYYFADGRLSMAGRARASRNSDFILKGDASGIYGWVVLRDGDAAYEYTTDEYGAVLVEEVPVAKIFPVCDFRDAGGESAVTPPVPGPAGPEPHIGPYPGTPIKKLQSLPGAQKVLYMDITQLMNGDDPIGWTKDQMWQIWQGFAASYSMFQVNVTTDPDVYKAAGVPNSGKANMLTATGRSSCGINSFGTTRGCTVYRKDTPLYSAGTTSHEMGHLMGLGHDGATGGVEYWTGRSEFQWVPIMGNHISGLRWANLLWQWSKGEYTNSNRKEDDLLIMSGKLQYRDDDIPGKVPLKFAEGTKVPAELNRGQIGRNTDSDEFTFQVRGASGRVNLKINRTEFMGGSMLDIDASILDATGKVVAQSNKIMARQAEFDVAVPAGDYTLIVKGGAEGTPANGFSDYSSLGFYAIEGTITGATVGTMGSAAAGNRIRVRPMAAGREVHIDFPAGARVGRIALVSTAGKTVFASRGRVDAIDLSGLAAGVYALSVVIDGGTVVRNVIKR